MLSHCAAGSVEDSTNSGLRTINLWGSKFTNRNCKHFGISVFMDIYPSWGF